MRPATRTLVLALVRHDIGILSAVGASVVRYNSSTTVIRET
jgi:hypothetical protein